MVQRLPDLQCTWLLLLICSNRHFIYVARTVPPEQNGQYADLHDAGMWRAMATVLGLSEECRSDPRCPPAVLPMLPLRMGCLGLRSAKRTAQAAY